MGVAAVWTFVNWLLNNAEKTRLELAEKAAANPKAARSSATKAQAVAWLSLIHIYPTGITTSSM